MHRGVYTFQLSGIFETLRPYAPYVVPLFWFGFFTAALLAIFFYDYETVRKTFVVSFFIGLLFFSTIAPVTLLPYIQWHKFSEPWPEEREYYEMRVVDENGDELRYDNEATLSFEGIRIFGLNHRMIQDYTAEENERIAAHLLREAEEHREDVNDRSLVRFIRFPEHGQTFGWRGKDLDEYGDFVGIRIYKMTFITSPDGTEVIDREEELLLEVFPDAETEVNEELLVPDREKQSNEELLVPDREKQSNEVFGDGWFLPASEQSN